MTRLACALALLLAGCASSPETKTAAPEKKRVGGPDYVKLGPKPIDDPVSVGIGKPVEFTYRHLVRDEELPLSTLLRGSEAVVVVFTSLGCPVTKRYAPTLQERAQRWAAVDVQLLVVDPSIVDEREDLLAAAERNGWTFPIAQDPDYAISDALGAQRTAATFLIGADGRLLYRGALDDQFGINYTLDAPRNRFMEDAIEATLAGDAVRVPATTAPGCVLSRVRLDDDDE